jgi:hypothetical protein
VTLTSLWHFTAPSNVRLRSAFQSHKPVICLHWPLNQDMKSRARGRRDCSETRRNSSLPTAGKGKHAIPIGLTSQSERPKYAPSGVPITFAHSSRTWTTNLPDLIQERDSCQKYPLVKETFF